MPHHSTKPNTEAPLRPEVNAMQRLCQGRIENFAVSDGVRRDKHGAAGSAVRTETAISAASEPLAALSPRSSETVCI